MSGGVDSSVAAAVCARQGYDVVGVTLQLYTSDNVSRKKDRVALVKIFTMQK